MRNTHSEDAQQNYRKSISKFEDNGTKMIRSGRIIAYARFARYKCGRIPAVRMFALSIVMWMKCPPNFVPSFRVASSVTAALIAVQSTGINIP
jgi:hypothetical protein